MPKRPCSDHKKSETQPHATINAKRLRFLYTKSQAQMRKTAALIAITTLLLIGCDNISSSSGYPVNFNCDATVYPYNIVQGYGQYIVVTMSKNGAAYKVAYYEGREKKELTIDLTAAQLTGRFYYGLGGLIIGTPMVFDGNKWAFDLACPKCDSRSRKLTVEHATGHAHCTNCGSKYDLNCGGLPIEGETRPLWRYRVIENGPNIIIMN